MHPDPLQSRAWTPSDVSVVVPTYRRGAVLLDSLRHLVALDPAPGEILVVDQTESPEPQVMDELSRIAPAGLLRRISLSPPSIPRAMNAGLKEARGELVLFFDDDIVPQPDVIAAHLEAYALHPGAWAVVGQIIQPEDAGQESGDRGQESGGRGQGDRGPKSEVRGRRGRGLGVDLDFAFNGKRSSWIENVMAGNLSVRRDRALAVGGFDENFIPPVSFRFETEFARRLVAAGGRIWFEPGASIRHLRAVTGGTRTRGGHLASASPVHGVGDYYYALRWGRGWDRLRYMLRRPFREVRTKFHLRHPWWIPVKFIGELRALRLAIRLHRAGPMLLTTNGSQGKNGMLEGWNDGRTSDFGNPVPCPLSPEAVRRILLLNTAPPDRPHGSMVRYGRMVREALERHGEGAFQVEEIPLSPTQAWLDRFPAGLREPIRYLCIAVRARRVLPAQQHCLVHLLDGSHAYLLAGIRRLRVPLVATVHDLIPALCLRGELAGPRPGRAAAWIVRRALSGLARADAWVADSSATRTDLVRLAGVDARRVVVVHPAVIPGLESAGEMAAEPYVLHVAGNNNFYKNRPAVVEAFALVRNELPVKLKLVGPPPDEALRRVIARTGTASLIEVHTDVSDAELARLYRDAAVLLFPSTYEGFGWPPLEAMSNGCPVVCSNAGSLSEIAGEAALTAPPDDIPALAGHTLAILRDHDLRRRLAEAGRHQVRRFTLEAMARGWCEACRAAETAFAGRNAHREGEPS